VPSAPEPHSPHLVVFAWFSVVFGLSSLLRIGLILCGAGPAACVSDVPLYCVYDVSLSALSAAAGWGLLRRRIWAPAVATISIGAMVALGAGSLVVLLLRYLHEEANARGPYSGMDFFRVNGAFMLLNAAIVLFWPAALIRLIRLPAHRVFRSVFSGAAVLLGVALLSLGTMLVVNGVVWFYLVGGAEVLR
jgi:hypothetical protein